MALRRVFLYSIWGGHGFAQFIAMTLISTVVLQKICGRSSGGSSKSGVSKQI